MQQVYTLSHTDAMKIIETIRQELDKQQLGAAVAVVDEHGELIAFLKTDGCRFPSINIAMNKAYTSAREQYESATLGNRSREDNFPITNYGDLRYVGWGGGVPILYQGKVVGAVGVSGLPEADDMKLAKLGVAALDGGIKKKQKSV